MRRLIVGLLRAIATGVEVLSWPFIVVAVLVTLFAYVIGDVLRDCARRLSSLVPSEV